MVFKATELWFCFITHRKTNMKTNVLSRKDQVDTMNNNKDVKLFKDKL